MITSMMMPISFMLLVRKHIGSIVKEKQSGMKEYLLINGCSHTAYHLGALLSEIIFVVLVSFFYPNLVQISFSLFLLMVFYSGTPLSYPSLLSFLLSLSLFLLGLLSSSQLLSCLFTSPSLATQLGSLLTLLPVGLSIYLQATDYQASISG